MTRGRVVLVLLSLTLAGLIAAAAAYREDLRLAWWRRQAARDVMETAFDPVNPTPAWKEILDAGEKGLPHLSKLLKDHRYEVWRAAVEVMDSTAGGDFPPHGFLRYLRERDACGLVLYLIPPPYERVMGRFNTTETIAGWRAIGDSRRKYWTGNAEFLAPIPEALGFLEEALAEESGPGENQAGLRDFKTRALNALESMLESPDVDRLILRAAIQDTDPEVRLHAVHALGRRRKVIEWLRTPTLEEWEQFAIHGDLGELGPRVLIDLGSIRCLVRVDHPRVLPILSRLHGRNDVRPLLEEALRGEDPLPLPIPKRFQSESGWRR